MTEKITKIRLVGLGRYGREAKPGTKPRVFAVELTFVGGRTYVPKKRFKVRRLGVDYVGLLVAQARKLGLDARPVVRATCAEVAS